MLRGLSLARVVRRACEPTLRRQNPPLPSAFQWHATATSSATGEGRHKRTRSKSRGRSSSRSSRFRGHVQGTTAGSTGGSRASGGDGTGGSGGGGHGGSGGGSEQRGHAGWATVHSVNRNVSKTQERFASSIGGKVFMANKASVGSDFSGVELVFFGTSSAVPSMHRNTSSLAMRFGGKTWLFDCGEGTQRQMLHTPAIRMGQINRVFVTHLHGDHVLGLAGFVISASSQVLERGSRTLDVYGPEGLFELLETTMRLTRSDAGHHLQGLITVHELTTKTAEQMAAAGKDTSSRFLRHRYIHPVRGGTLDATGSGSAGGLHWEVAKDWIGHGGADGEEVRVRAAALRHTMPCFGYVVEEADKRGAIDAAKATAMGLPPGPQYKDLKAGRDVELPGGRGVVRAVDVCSDPVKGRKIAILGDTCDSRAIEHLAAGADLLVHEATMDDAEYRKAIGVGHSTPAMAGAFARRIGAKAMVLTHFSNKPSTNPHVQVTSAQRHFKNKNVMAAHDFLGLQMPAVSARPPDEAQPVPKHED